MIRFRIFLITTMFIYLLILKSPVVLAYSDSVDVTFYYRTSTNPTIVYLPGEFNNWGNNQAGMVSDPQFGMNFNVAKDHWFKILRLCVGGPSPPVNPTSGVPGAYQYKFNENGNSWIVDPLNPRNNPLDHNNSYLYIQDPTIYHLIPNSVTGLVDTRYPEIKAYLFPSTEASIDTGSIRLWIDEEEYLHLGSYYNIETKHFVFPAEVPLKNGNHRLKLMVSTDLGSTGCDSTTFIIQAGFVQILTQSNSHHLRSTIDIEGIVEDTSLIQATLFHNNLSREIAVSNGLFLENRDLIEGDNSFYVSILEPLGEIQTSNTVIVTYIVDHSPKPSVTIDVIKEKICFSVEGNDSDGDPLTYQWNSDDLVNPESLGIDNQGEYFEITAPLTEGEYYIDLIATDPDENVGSTRCVFVVDKTGNIQIPTVDSNPGWVQDGIVYEIYLPAFTSEGTFKAATERLSWIQSLGANIIWLMPIYDNGELINELNAGYNITDFYTIHPQLGNMSDFEYFLEEAHNLNLRVILDSTPNHVGENHFWLNDIQLYQDYSNYRPIIEKRVLGDSRGLGQFTKQTGSYTWYVHYSNWTLANLNYQNIETVDYMLNMYKWWILEKYVDGFRMDVYWGPQNRYGKNDWWRPFREEIKRIKPDLFILGETDGTGTGSENNYADGGGACDAAYDWAFYNEIKNIIGGGGLYNLDNRVKNYSPTLDYNYYTGENTHYLRFLENHDEQRIGSLYNIEQVKPGAVLLLTIPGIPMIYAGQEIGETSRRGKIDWSRGSSDNILKFYQRLIGIRNSFQPFKTTKIERIPTNNSRCYAFLRPFRDKNGIVVINFSTNFEPITLQIDESTLELSGDSLQTDCVYYMNDVLNDTFYLTSKSELSQFPVSLDKWESAVFVLSDSILQFMSGIENMGLSSTPSNVDLFQNYPNPFNQQTVIKYQIINDGDVQLMIVNLLGQKVSLLVSDYQEAGNYEVKWNGYSEQEQVVPSGIYIVRLTSGNMIKTRKIIFMK